MSKKCSLRVFNGKNMLYGTAAQLYKISSEGGWDEYHVKLVEKIATKVIREVLEEQNRPVLVTVK